MKFTLHIRTLESAPAYYRIRVEAPCPRRAVSDAVDRIKARGDVPIDEAPGDPRVDPRKTRR